VPQGLDHDPPAKEKLVPLGIFTLATGALTLCFGQHETSDFWADCLPYWWTQVRAQHRGVRRLVIYLDNGPKNSGRRTQFLKRLTEFADWSGLEIRLVYYPPSHSKYNPIERCRSSLQKKWNGTLLTCWSIVKGCAALLLVLIPMSLTLLMAGSQVMQFGKDTGGRLDAQPTKKLEASVVEMG